ncbi:extracellular solute-binding protein family 1 [Catenulispora acidiphila DSM 44928]|uniref:Extracellular solute-binding protein family 1 n=1 Tax=Catenulispora acidiphila (strain DSM 44928 / JCM 14897 / NBRC 102108 / NRRL B-24433 / ID139908) TaxID=479433 RepID=C7Q822_CATAD|nr:extracellular solute-binding protein [Catenulispora acidiphila]ACU74189.1 extracellular solute-binding protein family 1 [Catenulispora acidiphila DSM 44928]
MLRARKRSAAAIALLVSGAMLASGCSSSKSSSSSTKTTTDSGQQITLKVGLFGTFGFKEAGLYDQYMKLHPNIKIVEDSVEDEGQYYTSLQTHLSAGSGLDDIQGIEVGRIADVDQNLSSKFVDLNSLGAASLKSNFYPAKWSAATTSDGKVMALGTDYGPLAICYRTDLFKAAGLPTDSAGVSALWPDWNSYVQTGLKYKAKAPANQAWTDTAGGTFNAIVGQSANQYYDSSGKEIADTNPAVQNAWNIAMQLSTQGLTAKLSQFTPAWNQAFTTGSFATIACPAWMTGYIKSEAGAMTGDWGVAKIPGGTGDWGGSYLAIPKASKHQKEAYDLINWLTNPDQQKTMFTSQGHFPSSQTAAQDPSIASHTDPYFGDSPLGQIYAASAATIPQAVLGAKDGTIKDTFSKAITRVEAQGQAPQASWTKALSDIKAATSG